EALRRAPGRNACDHRSARKRARDRSVAFRDRYRRRRQRRGGVGGAQNPCAVGALQARPRPAHEAAPLTTPLVRDMDRIPPSNLDAEMALLGSILVDREIMGAVVEIVKSSDFYASFHETIYQALITLSEELKARGFLDKIGGLAYLTSLMDTVPTAASAEYYARIVKEKAALRSLIHVGTQITQIGYEAEEDVDAALDRAEQLVYDVGQHHVRGQFVKVANLLVAAFQQIERRHYAGGDFTGFTSGFRDIDEYTTGFHPGNLIIIAA